MERERLQQPFRLPYIISALTFDPRINEQRQQITDEALLATYHYGERVTRQNFTPMLVQSFHVSKGDLNLQHLYFSWLAERTNFDYRSSLLNYIRSGGFGILATHEQEYIANAYKKISHKNEFRPLAFDAQVEGQTRSEAYFNEVVLIDALKFYTPDEMLIRIGQERKKS
jgi:hypothetical protein